MTTAREPSCGPEPGERRGEEYRQSGSIELTSLREAHWGAGCIAEIGGVLDRAGAADVAMVTSASLANSPLLERLAEATGQRIRAVYEIPAHVPSGAVIAVAADLARVTRGVDVIVSFGGGSSIDGAKAALVVSGRRAQHISVPTNLSGAELSSGYGVTEQRPGGAFKQSFRDPAVTPSVIFYDPDLTVSTPPQLWAASGVKALDHAIEGLLHSAALPVVSTLAREGIRELTTALAASVTDLDRRAEAQLAAWQCYYAPANLRYGLSHRLGHILGGTFGVPHSATSGVTLAPVLRASGAARPEVSRSVAEALGVAVDERRDRSGEEAVRASADRLDELVSELGLPRRLSGLGLPDRSALATIERLLRAHYPETVTWCDAAGSQHFAEWLDGLW
jgi:maleylacetate reductase